MAIGASKHSSDGCSTAARKKHKQMPNMDVLPTRTEVIMPRRHDATDMEIVIWKSSAKAVTEKSYG